MEPAPVTVRSGKRQALRPLLWWIVVSSLLFLWRFHEVQSSKATVQFTVSMEGQTGPVLHEATVNGVRYLAGQPSGVGRKKLVVKARNAEPFETNVFVWYGGAAFGNITLPRTRGKLDLDISPRAESVRITGSEERLSLTNFTREPLSLPTGRYLVETKFARFSVERTVEITRHQTTLVSIVPSITALQLSSVPEKAEFELTSIKGPPIYVSGGTPVTIQDLPVGEYALTISRGEYRKKLPVTLTTAQPTNILNVEFKYAKLSINSDPTDASVSAGEKVVGRTPLNLDLPPGEYRFQIGKQGFFATNVTIALAETDSPTIAVTLGNVSFAEAMDRARRSSSGFSPDYPRALAEVENALSIKPGDETALQLKRTIEFRRHLQTARLFQRNDDFVRALSAVEMALKMSATDRDALALKDELERGQRAAEAARIKAEAAAVEAKAQARLVHPEKVFQDTINRLRNENLFPSHVLRFNESLDNVRASLKRALANKPEWTIRRDAKDDPETVIITADLRGLGRQNVVIVAGQTTDKEVTVHFKLFSYSLGDHITLNLLSGVTDDSYKPKTVDRDINRDIDAFKKRIKDELR